MTAHGSHIDGADLDVKWVPVELVLTLELLTVGLSHLNRISSRQGFWVPFKDLNFICDIHSIEGEAPLFSNYNCGVHIFCQLDRLVLVCVAIDYKGQPHIFYLLFGSRH